MALKRCAIARERNFRTVDGKKKKKPRQDTKIDKRKELEWIRSVVGSLQCDKVQMKKGC